MINFPYHLEYLCESDLCLRLMKIRDKIFELTTKRSGAPNCRLCKNKAFIILYVKGKYDES